MGRPCAEQCTTAYTQRVVSSAAMTARGTANLAGPNLPAAAMLPLLVSNAVEFFAYVGIFVVVGLVLALVTFEGREQEKEKLAAQKKLAGQKKAT